MFKSWFRPIYELNAFVVWSIAFVLMALSAFPYKWFALLPIVLMAGWRGLASHRAIQFRLRLQLRYLQFISAKDLYQKIREALGKKCFYLGEGYEWDPAVTQVCCDILRMPKSDIPSLPKWLPQKLIDYWSPKNVLMDKSIVEMGKPWIKAMSTKIGPIVWPIKAIEGHTLVAGTTGSGKTRTYEVLCTGIIRHGSVLIIIDPKNDFEWMERVRKECARTKRKFLYFKQAEPGKSIRLNPLANWNQPSEIATRISQLMEEGPFREFAHSFIDRVVKGQLYVGERPNLRSVFKYVEGSIDMLLERCLVKYFVDKEYPDFEMKARSGVPTKSVNGYLDGLVALYDQFVKENAKQERNVECEAIAGLVQTYKHPKEHYAKIIFNVIPLMQMLSTGETGLMLAPDVTDIYDEREIWDIRRVIEQNAVLYIGMDSLSNSQVAKAVNSMILAEISSVAGEIYNFVGEKERKDIFLIIDEVAEAINEQVIQVLNKGRSAGFRAFVALQSIKDLEAKLQSAAKMIQVLGNLNNQIVLRLEDSETVDWIVKKLGKTYVNFLKKTRSQGTGTEQHAFEFSGNISKSEESKEVPLVPEEVFYGLPNLQYVARFTGGATFQGTIPIIKD